MEKIVKRLELCIKDLEKMYNEKLRLANETEDGYHYEQYSDDALLIDEMICSIEDAIENSRNILK